EALDGAPETWLDLRWKNDVERGADVQTKKVRWRHADDRETHALDREATANHIGCASEQSLPRAETENGHGTVRTAVAPIIARPERASLDRADTEHGEVVATRPDRIDESDLACVRQTEAIARPCERSIQ